MNTIVLPLGLILLALLLIAFGPSRAGAAGAALMRVLRAAAARLRRGWPARMASHPPKRPR